MSESVLLTDDQPVDPDDELLVAYLDDELDDASRKAVEQRLVADEKFRVRLQSLQTGWEWLDELPTESTNEKFVESTIELAVEDLIPSKQKKVRWYHRHWKTIALTSALAIALIAGAGATTIQRQRALTRDLQELAIAEDHEAYKLGGDFSLYRQLAYNERWQKMIETMQKVGRREMASESIVATLPLADRGDALAALPTETREKLLGRWQAYNGYGEATKQRIREVAKEVRQADDSEILLRTMKAASVWLEDLSVELRDEVTSTDETIRKNAISVAIDVTLAKLTRDSGQLISDETSDQIYLWLQILLERRRNENPTLSAFMDRLSTMTLQAGRDPAWVEWGMIRAMIDEPDSRGRSFGFGGGSRFGSGFGGPGRPPGPRPEDRSGAEANGQPDPASPPDGRTRESGPRPGPPRVPRITDQEYAELLEQILHDEARADLQLLTSFSRELTEGDDLGAAVVDTLRNWARESIRRNSPIFDLEETPLDRYRAREDPDELDLLPPSEILDEIYLRPQPRGWSRGGPR